MHSVTYQAIESGKYDDRIKAIQLSMLNQADKVPAKLQDRWMYAVANTHELLPVTLTEYPIRKYIHNTIGLTQLNQLSKDIIGEFNARQNSRWSDNTARTNSNRISRDIQKDNATDDESNTRDGKTNPRDNNTRTSSSSVQESTSTVSTESKQKQISYGTTKDDPIYVYVDGSHIKGTDKLGYGAYASYKGEVYTLSGTQDSEASKALAQRFSNHKFSNPTMELLGFVETLRQFANTNDHIVIVQDYTGIINWGILWNYSEGSSNRADKPHNTKQPYIKHLVEEAEKLIKQLENNGGSLRITWTKGHDKSEGNNQADAYAKNPDNFNTFKIESENDTLAEVKPKLTAKWDKSNKVFIINEYPNVKLEYNKLVVDKIFYGYELSFKNTRIILSKNYHNLKDLEKNLGDELVELYNLAVERNKQTAIDFFHNEMGMFNESSSNPQQAPISGKTSIKEIQEQLDTNNAQGNLLGFLVDAVAQSNPSLSIQIADIDTNGYYDPSTNTIVISSKVINGTYGDEVKLSVINHEIIHALTETGLSQDTKASRDIQEIYNRLVDNKQAILAKHPELGQVQSNGKTLLDIMLENPNEMVAYGLTDNRMQAVIADMDMSGLQTKASSSNIKSFFKIVFELFGFKTDKANANLVKFAGIVHKAMTPYDPNLVQATTKRSSDIVGLVDDIATQAKILQGKPVIELNEKDIGIPEHKVSRNIISWAKQLFNDWHNKANNPKLGEVTLNERSIRDSVAHGMNAYKAIAFAFVKDVIEKGTIIATDSNSKQESIYISAPVTINGLENVVTVLVHRDVNTQRMYLHSVSLKENLLTPRVSKAPINIGKQNGSTVSVGQSASQHDNMLSPADVHNILQQALNYNPLLRHNSIDVDDIRANNTNHVNNMNATDVFKQLATNVSAEHNAKLDRVIDTVLGTFYKNNAKANPNIGKIKHTALINGFNSSDKEAYVTEALILAIKSYADTHKGSMPSTAMENLYAKAMSRFKSARDLF